MSWFLFSEGVAGMAKKSLASGERVRCRREGDGPPEPRPRLACSHCTSNEFFPIAQNAGGFGQKKTHDLYSLESGRHWTDGVRTSQKSDFRESATNAPCRVLASALPASSTRYRPYLLLPNLSPCKRSCFASM